MVSAHNIIVMYNIDSHLNIERYCYFWTGKKVISYYEKSKEQVSFQTMVVSDLVLVLTNVNKILIID